MPETRSITTRLDWHTVYTRFLDRSVLTTARVSGFAGLFWLFAGLAAFVSTFLTGYQDKTFYDVPADIAGIQYWSIGAVVCGFLILIADRAIGEWAHHALLVLSVVTISALTWQTQSSTMGLAMSMLFSYVVLDAVMYFSWKGYLFHSALTVAAAAVVLPHVEVPLAAVVLMATLAAGQAVTVAWLARFAAESHYDQLTQLRNRVGLGKLIESRLRSSRTAGVLLLSFDRSTSSDYCEERITGTQLTRRVADAIRGFVGDQGQIALLSDDEYGILLEEGSAGACVAFADRLITSLAPEGVASVGLALTQPTDTVDIVLDHASLALMEAKEDGGGQSHLYGSDARAAKELEEAIAEGQLYLLYQPLVRLSDRSLKSFEALVRWRHPIRGLVSPAVFVPQAEKSGAIHQLGRWTIAETCRAIAEHDSAIQVSVNASLPELQDSGYAQQVIGAVQATGIKPSSLIVEVTEAVLERDTKAVIRSLTLLREHGIKIAIDDFGSGYSSLRWLDALPADLLKVDRVFVTPITSLDQRTPVLKGIIGIARELGMQTIVEGVEDDVQLEVLTRLGADYVQGFLFAKPSSIDEGLAVVARHEREFREGRGR